MSLENLQSLKTNNQQDSRLSLDQHQRQQQRSTLLESQEKTFEKAYFHQKELNEILKKQIEHKEKEYKELFAENKQLKAKAAEYKSRIRELEDKLNEYRAKLDQYRKKVKDFEKRSQTLPPKVLVHISSTSSQREPAESIHVDHIGVSKTDNGIGGVRATDDGVAEEIRGKPIDYLRADKDVKVIARRGLRKMSGAFEVEESESTSQNPPGSNDSREIMSPLRLMAKFDHSDSKRNSNRKISNESEEEAKEKTNDSQKSTGRERKEGIKTVFRGD